MSIVNVQNQINWLELRGGFMRGRCWGKRGMVRWKSEGYTLAFSGIDGFARVQFLYLMIS